MTQRQSSENTPFSHLGEIPVQQFLAEYWQKKPLLVRQAFPGYRSPLAAEELAGFALEEEIESRLVEEQVDSDPLLSQWQVTHGPLPEDIFSRLPASHWTLLVQAVDQLVPELGDLLNRFRFVPNWRLDDLMVSYATDGGGVGPHFDYYDVFLLQAEGRRRWRLGQMCDSGSSCRTDTPMTILKNFETQAEFVLEPGDMLYVPPGLAHWGTAEGDCMTFSIGFRAPSYSDLLLDFSTDLAADLNPDQRYSDTGIQPPRHPGEITDDAVVRIEAILRELVSDKSKIAHWLAEYGTHSRRSAPEPIHTQWPDAGPADAQVALKPRVRAAYVAAADGFAVLYLNGTAYACSTELARALSSYQPFARAAFQRPQDETLLASLFDNGWLTGHA